MNMLVLGGDTRSAYLALLARENEWTVEARYMDCFNLPLPRANAQSGWDAVVLPYPVGQKDGILWTPLDSRRVPMYEALEGIGERRYVFGGTGTKLWILDAQSLGEDEGFVLTNAAITAEGAVFCAMRDSAGGIMGARCLILGCGRIARFLAQKLDALGARVTVAARKAKDDAYISANGWTAAAFHSQAWIQALEEADLVFNTVPFPVLDPTHLKRLKPQAIVYELASAPYGFSMETAEKAGIDVHMESGLPGRYAPKAAAEAMLDVITRKVREEERDD